MFPPSRLYWSIIKSNLWQIKFLHFIFVYKTNGWHTRRSDLDIPSCQKRFAILIIKLLIMMVIKATLKMTLMTLMTLMSRDLLDDLDEQRLHWWPWWAGTCPPACRRPAPSSDTLPCLSQPLSNTSSPALDRFITVTIIMEASITTHIVTLEKKSLLKAYLTEQLPPLMPPPTTSATVMVKKIPNNLTQSHGGRQPLLVGH